MIKTLAMATALGLAAAAANAAITVDFGSFTGTTTQASSFTYAVPGTGVTVTSQALRSSNAGGPAYSNLSPVNVTRNGAGLGVDAGGFLVDNNDELDGLGVNEVILLTLSVPVYLASLDLSNVFSGLLLDDDWDIFVDTDGSGPFTQIGFSSEEDPFDDFNPLTKYQRIAIGANGEDDSFRVQSLTIASVPVPAAGLLLAGALGGLALARRRKTA